MVGVPHPVIVGVPHQSWWGVPPPPTIKAGWGTPHHPDLPGYSPPPPSRPGWGTLPPPPEMVAKVKTLPSVILRMRAVIIVHTGIR